ncbi:chaperonin 10-like protein [Aspergillus affinis]|uniref:chaperonin 10-like protein n=1 Tax=Aspergillus affinis TaxID=1070780 RepID=UPI0022FE1FDD|nr:chaperonin 10-like protein [Aspergillus affinis]KAI9034785.1 chaperonin 10-like protein [Aspergillus affinis]
MKEAFVDNDISLTIRDTDIPVPKAGQVLIHVVVSGTNPKDWNPWWPIDGTPTNQGDDIAGYIEAVGEGVMGFHKGDKVAAFHQVMTPHGSYAEYAIAPEYTTYAFVETLIDREKGDTIIDYREGDEVVRAKIKEAAGGRSIHYAYDAPYEGIIMGQTIAGSVHMPPAAGKTVEDNEFSAAIFQFIGRGLAQGWFSGHQYEVRPGGLTGLEGALQDLKAGKASAIKYVVRIGETEGVI